MTAAALAQPLHATLIAARRAGLWRGVLLFGPSGAGKSDLALRAMARSWRLVADDRVRVWLSGGVAYGRAAAPLEGLIEARGLGVLAQPHLPFARLSLAVEGAVDGPMERMPEPALWPLGLGAGDPPRLRLDLREASALAKLAYALDAVARGAL